MRKVKLAKNAGFCFGVQRAVEEAIRIQKEYMKKVYTLGPLIHNNDVVKYLEEHHIFAIDLKDIDTLKKGDVIVIRSHGVAKDILELLESKELVVLNATCPFVSNIQKKVDKFSSEGYDIIILGDKNHPEVIGINGWCKNKAIITDGKSPLPTNLLKGKICVVAQTTEKLENWNKTIENLKNVQVEELVTYNTICSATNVRQESAEKLSKEVDAMIVIGGKNSSNTTKLYEIAKSNCKNTIHIENSSELPEEYINNLNFKKIGITAGASTPDWIIREVINIMQDENIKNDEQAKLMEEIDKTISIGYEIEGEILYKNNDGIVVSIVGNGRDGVIPYKELTAKEDPKEFAAKLNVGDKIKAKVVKLKDEDNNVVLSRIEYEKKEAFEELEKLFKEGTIFDVTISETRDKGLVAYYKGVRIFIPASQIDIKYIANKEDFKNMTIPVKLIEFAQGNPSKIIASRRVILEEEAAKKEEEAWSNLHVGDVVKGEIKRFTNFGAFAEVNGIDGLIHLSQISWNHVKKAEDYLKKGDIVDLKIIDLDKEAKKLSLSIKALTPEPWSNVEEKYPVDSIVLGKVVRINDFGAFVELEPGVDGLVHISKISHERIENPAQVLEVGQEIKAKILSVDAEKKRISLSMKDI